MSAVVTGSDEAVADCVDLWVRAVTARDGMAPMDGVGPRTAGKFDHPAIRFAIVDGERGPVAFALTNRLSESSADPGERESHDAPYTAYIELLAVDPAASARGLGRALLRDAMEASTAAGCGEVVLHVRIDNANAIHLYESEGFAMVGEPRMHELTRAPMIEMRRVLAR